MNKIILSFFIIVFLFKTGNVFSSNNIFNVDNILVKNDKNLSRQKILDNAFEKGFKKLTKKILINKDVAITHKTELKEIKKLISSYQIVENDKLKEEKKVQINLVFNREKINSFFYQKNISYADVSETNVVLFPVMIEDDNFFLFSDNYFYNNWNQKEKDEENEFINYILPVENLEDIQLINSNKNDLESIPIEKILSNYDLNDYIFLVLNNSENKVNIFLKGSISGNRVIKNFSYNALENSKEIKFKNIIAKIKLEINEIWKLQNLIDIRTPSFLNTVLEIKKNSDLLTLREALNKIDLIENYYVLELNKNYAKVKIKYLGKINKIKTKLNNQGIKVIILDNEWKLKLI